MDVMNNAQISQTIINQWQQDYQMLHDILNSEQLALEKRDFEQLKLVTKEKNRAVQQINSHQLPESINQPNLATMQAFKQYCMTDPNLQNSWNELMELVEKCCFKNEVNARLINLLHQSNTRTFNIIKGFDPENNIYNSTGNRTAIRHHGVPLSA